MPLLQSGRVLFRIRFESGCQGRCRLAPSPSAIASIAAPASVATAIASIATIAPVGLSICGGNRVSLDVVDGHGHEGHETQEDEELHRF